MRVTATVDLAVIDHEPPGPGFVNLPGLGENAPPVEPGKRDVYLARRWGECGDVGSGGSSCSCCCSCRRKHRGVGEKWSDMGVSAQDKMDRRMQKIPGDGGLRRWDLLAGLVVVVSW